MKRWNTQVSLAIHIGSAKCGSTTLQRNFFERHPGLGVWHHLLKDEGGREKADLLSTCLKAGRKEAMSTEGAARLLSAELARHATFVYSNEGLTSNAGRNWRRKAADIEKLFSLETMARHHPRVIFIYRSVSDFLWSTFRHEVFHRTEDGGRSYVQFLRSEIELARRREASFLFGDICERYDAFLPEGRLFVADLADVSKKPRDVNSALSAFLGIDRLDELVPALTKKRNETNRKYRTKKPEAVDRVRQELHHREIQTLLDEVRAIETAQLVKLRRIAERHA